MNHRRFTIAFLLLLVLCAYGVYYASKHRLFENSLEKRPAQKKSKPANWSCGKILAGSRKVFSLAAWFTRWMF